MKLAFSRPTADDAQQGLLFEKSRAVGYDGLQLKEGQYRAFLDDPGGFARRWGDWPGLTAGLITAGRLDEAGVASLRRVFRFAEATKSDRVIFCLGVPREGLSEEDIGGLAKQLSQLGREARDRGTKLSLHNHYNSPVMHAGDFDTFFGAVEDGAVGLTLDTAHAVKSGIDDVAGLIRRHAEHIDNFHLKDFAAGQWRVLGEGEIDFAPIFDAVRAVGYDGWVSTDEESGGELATTVQSCYDFMKDGLK